MSLLSPVLRLNAFAAKYLEPLQSLSLLAARLHVGWVFLQSGYLKFSSWESTLGLFRDEYHVPLLSPAVAAVAGTLGELFFPVLLVLGLWSRLGALGLSAVNAMAVVSYYHVLGGEGFEAALGQHLIWAILVAGVALFGPGKYSVDYWLEKSANAAGPVICRL
jgi:putative oxidoreductase